MLYSQLESLAKLPNPSWAICTSATHNYAKKALSAAGLTPPDVFVAAEDVERGKPASVYSIQMKS